MCGIAGFLGKMPFSNPEDMLQTMAARLHHRGPDASGHEFLPDVSVGLAHARLSVIDLSNHANQPMQSRSGRFLMVYNGEIYNFKSLREELLNAEVSFSTSSDTEVLLEAIATWGTKKALAKCQGMFAVAIYDRQTHTLTLARDRAGEKPLYYSIGDKFMAFASELKALFALPGLDKNIDKESLSAYMRHSYVPAPFSIRKNTYKLLPGSFIEIDLEKLQSASNFSPFAGEKPFSPERYWSLNEVAQLGAESRRSSVSMDSAAEELDSILRTVIKEQMISDVPLGAFLSGGIDSSTVVSIMQDLSPSQVKTFTIGFDIDRYDESKYARETAELLGTDHHELRLSPVEAMGLVDEMPTIYDEPFGDASQIPTYLVSRLAKDRVTVALSGDGGDELFGGYYRYIVACRLWRKTQHYPRGIRKAVAGGINLLNPEQWNSVVRLLGPLAPSALRSQSAGDKLHKLRPIFTAPNFQSLVRQVVSLYHQPENVVQGAQDRNHLQWLWPQPEQDLDDERTFMHVDFQSYMVDQILTKVDRAAMAVSLETRVPLLDSRVIESAYRSPTNLLIRGNDGKLLLKKVLSRYIPPEHFDRPKKGFAVPLADWLRGGLKPWAEKLLDPDLMDLAGLDGSQVRTLWNEHQKPSRNRQDILWNILMYLSWHQTHQS